MIEEHGPEIKLKLFSSTANNMSLNGPKCTSVLKTLIKLFLFFFLCYLLKKLMTDKTEG